MPDTTYVLELKLDSSAATAIEQIYEKQSYLAYLQQGKQIVLLGVNFAAKEHNVASWQGELLDQNGKRLCSLVPELSSAPERGKS